MKCLCLDGHGDGDSNGDSDGDGDGHGDGHSNGDNAGIQIGKRGSRTRDGGSDHYDGDALSDVNLAFCDTVSMLCDAM
jgi:hypothetical protein